MMIIIIHGDDVTVSRNQLSKIKDNFSGHEYCEIMAEKTTLKDILNIINTNSLLSNKRLIVIHKLLSLGLDKSYEKFILELSQINSADVLVLWEIKEINNQTLKKYFPKAKIILCKIPQIIFQFLDSIGKENNMHVLTAFQNLAKTKEPEFIYAMLLRQIRLLLAIKSNDGNTLPSWQLYKLESQSRYFSFDQLLSMYRQLINYEYKIKSGQTPYTIKELLDIFFISI